MRTRSIALLSSLVAVGAAIVVMNVGSADGVTAAHEYNHVLSVVLDGRKEIGNDGQRRAGNLDGFGSFSGVLAGRKLCYGLQVTGIGRPLAAHIHRGGANANGEVVVTLADMQQNGSSATGSDCTTLSRSLADRLVRSPGRFYVNVHTQKFASGAIRGQLFHPARGS
jgi:hypothetical protein